IRDFHVTGVQTCALPIGTPSGTAGAHPQCLAAWRSTDPLGEAALRGCAGAGAAHRAASGLQARQRLLRAGDRPEAQRHRECDEAGQPGHPPAAPAGGRFQPRPALVPVPQLRLADRPAMIDFAPLIQALEGSPLADWSRQLPEQFAARLAAGHGDLPRWRAALAALPELRVEQHELLERLAIDGPCSSTEHGQLRQALLGLAPWRKGPFHLFGLHLDTEWRSDWKWQRVSPHLDLSGRRVLDVGCGNGYYLWRMLGAGAREEIGRASCRDRG